MTKEEIREKVLSNLVKPLFLTEDEIPELERLRDCEFKDDPEAVSDLNRLIELALSGKTTYTSKERYSRKREALAYFRKELDELLSLAGPENYVSGLVLHILNSMSKVGRIYYYTEMIDMIKEAKRVVRRKCSKDILEEVEFNTGIYSGQVLMYQTKDLRINRLQRFDGQKFVEPEWAKSFMSDVVDNSNNWWNIDGIVQNYLKALIRINNYDRVLDFKERYLSGGIKGLGLRFLSEYYNFNKNKFPVSVGKDLRVIVENLAEDLLEYERNYESVVPNKIAQYQHYEKSLPEDQVHAIEDLIRTNHDLTGKVVSDKLFPLIELKLKIQNSLNPNYQWYLSAALYAENLRDALEKGYLSEITEEHLNTWRKEVFNMKKVGKDKPMYAEGSQKLNEILRRAAMMPNRN